jgi:hypothetical protein
MFLLLLANHCINLTVKLKSNTVFNTYSKEGISRSLEDFIVMLLYIKIHPEQHLRIMADYTADILPDFNQIQI